VRFRWLRFAPPPANIRRASGALGVCQQYLKPQHSKGFALAVLLDHYQANEGQDGFAKALIKRAVFLMWQAGKIEPEENVMSLIVARIIEDEIRIVSDTKVTNYSAVHNTPLNGSLKCVVVSPACCVCFAGRAGLAQVAMTPILKSNGLDRASITEHRFTHGFGGNRSYFGITALMNSSMPSLSNLMSQLTVSGIISILSRP
jgi:hypothetical protein